MSTTKTKTESKLVNINSANAFLKNNGTYNSDVLFRFPGLVKPAQHITNIQFQLVDAQIPVSFYNINYTNNTLNYQISSVSYTITASVGNYNFNSLASHLIAKFLANGHVFTITINKQNGIITLATPATNFILQVSSLFTVLGLFLSNHTSTSFSLSADYPLNLLGITKIKIQSINLNTYNVDSANNGFSNNIGLIPVDQPSFGLIVYENKSSSKFLLRDNRVDEIDIQLVDQNNNLINFNNIDWSLTILIETSYEVESLSQLQMTDILKEQNKILSDLANSEEPTPTQEQPINPVSTDDLEFFVYSNPNLII